MKNFALIIVLAAAATLISLPAAFANDVMVIGSFARASATPQATSATAYLTIANHGAGADRLLSIATPSAAMAHLHQTTESDGVISMTAVESLDLAPGGTVEMAPGGLHIMLTRLKSPLKQGDKLHLELTLAKAGKLVVDVPVKAVAATGP